MTIAFERPVLMRREPRCIADALGSGQNYATKGHNCGRSERMIQVEEEPEL